MAAIISPNSDQKQSKNKEMDPNNSHPLEITRCPNVVRFSDQTNLDLCSLISQSASLNAAEKKLKLFALRLAIIEKIGSSIGQLAFVWATVVLLGGFASALKPKDFWFVTAVLVVESTRLVSRRHELEWHHQSTRLLPAANTLLRRIQSSPRRLLRALSSFWSGPSVRHHADNIQQLDDRLAALTQPKRSRPPTDVSYLPYAGWVFVNKNIMRCLHYWQQIFAAPRRWLFVSKNISRLLFWQQIFAAAACVVLSLMRLGLQDYGDDGQANEKSALNVFYSLALADALMFLLEKLYWFWRMGRGEFVERVCDECELGSSEVVSFRRFFYDGYSKCIDGSIFDGLKMDLGSFAEELLKSDSRDEQITGAKILLGFVENKRFAPDTVRKIGNSMPIIQRLFEMLNWKDPAEKDARRAASEIVSKLASQKKHGLQVAAIPGAMKSITSLLYTGVGSREGRPYEASPRAVVVDREDYEFSAFNLLGLLILKRLARDHDNCSKIGKARELLVRVIDLTSIRATLLRDETVTPLRIKTVRRALKVVKILVYATGETGKILRREISKIVYAVSNIRELLQYYGEEHLQLQKLGVEILTSLAMDEEAREKIGATGSVMGLIVAAFFRPIVCNAAGEALAMLILESEINCEIMLRGRNNDVVGRLVVALNDPVLRVNAARILRGLCAYSATERSHQLLTVADAMPMVLKTIMEEKEKEEQELLEVSIGLALQILKLGIPEVLRNEIERAGIKDQNFVEKLVQILRRYESPEGKVVRMRRFVIGLATILMKYEHKYVVLFRDLEMEQVLMRTAETTSELERFNLFSGNVGLGRHEVMISSLVDAALELLARDSDSG